MTSLKGYPFKKLVKPAAKWKAVSIAQKKCDMSERRACMLIGLSRSTMRYDAVDRFEDDSIKESVYTIAGRWKRFGNRIIKMMLKHEGIKSP